MTRRKTPDPTARSADADADADARARLRRVLDELEELKVRGMCEEEALTIAARSLAAGDGGGRDLAPACAGRIRDSLIAGAASNLAVARKVFQRIPADHATDQPAGIVNHPVWTLAHLLHYHDAIAALIAGRPVADPALHPDAARVDEGSTPTADSDAYPTWNVLARRYIQGHARLLAALREMPADVPGRAPGLERWKATFSDTSQALTYLVIHHEAIHIGQIMAWERACRAVSHR